LKLTFIIACYKSEKTVEGVVSEIVKVAALRPNVEYEIVLVNDCSPDNVYGVIKRAARDNHRIKGISLAKNVGKAAAILAGISVMTGDIAVFLDDDGQCPVERTWDLVDEINDDVDMAIADYPHKKQALYKNIGSNINQRLIRFLIGQPDDVTFSNFNARKRFVCEEMANYKNPYPNLQALALQVTHRIKMVPMEERERKIGKTGYTFLRSFKLLINGCTGFSVKPLRISSLFGIAFSCIGFFLSFLTVVKKLIHPSIQAGFTSIIALLLLIGGIIMLLLGMIGEYLGRIYICINNAPQYVIKDEINCGGF